MAKGFEHFYVMAYKIVFNCHFMHSGEWCIKWEVMLTILFPQRLRCIRASLTRQQPPLPSPRQVPLRPPLRLLATPRGETTMSPMAMEQPVLWLAWDCSSTSLSSAQTRRCAPSVTLLCLQAVRLSLSLREGQCAAFWPLEMVSDYLFTVNS